MRELSPTWLQWCREMQQAECRRDYHTSRGIYTALSKLCDPQSGIVSESAIRYREAGFPKSWNHDGQWLHFPLMCL